MSETRILRIDSGLTLNWRHRFLKRSFDVVFSLIGLGATGWLIAIAILGARYSTKKTGLFRQRRVGRHGREFEILKVRTMRDVAGVSTMVTTDTDPRVTRFGRFLRKYKIDELPQLYNVFRGDMSFVGPRPDVAELVQSLKGADRIVLSVRPGITGPASIKYRHEEELLAMQSSPDVYNQTVIFPDKTRINREYVERYRFLWDIQLLFQTLLGGGEVAEVAPAGSVDRERAA